MQVRAARDIPAKTMQLWPFGGQLVVQPLRWLSIPLGEGSTPRDIYWRKCRKLHQSFIKFVDLTVYWQEDDKVGERDVKCFSPLACQNLVRNDGGTLYHCDSMNPFWGVLQAPSHFDADKVNMKAIMKPAVVNKWTTHHGSMARSRHTENVTLMATVLTNTRLIKAGELLVMPFIPDASQIQGTTMKEARDNMATSSTSGPQPIDPERCPQTVIEQQRAHTLHIFESDELELHSGV